LTNPEDTAHSRAVAFDESKQRPTLVTTEEVLTEFLTFFGSKGPFLRRKAAAVVRSILSDVTIHVLPQTHETFRAGFELYSARPDKGYSLPDCISMETMRREGLTDVLTNDRHFEQEGFRPVFQDL
jgi:predicted nucleic acid-binding protein